MVRYAMVGLQNTVLAARYRIELPDEEALAEEIARTRPRLEDRSCNPSGPEDWGDLTEAFGQGSTRSRPHRSIAECPGGC